MNAANSPLEQALADQLVAISVSDSPDLGRLGLLERNLRQTVAAIVTRLVRHGARIAYGGNLDKRGYTYHLYPSIAQAYASAALRAARPPFVHYVAAYLAQDPAELAAHVQAVGSFAEVRLVDGKSRVTRVVATRNEVIGSTPTGEIRLKDRRNMAAFAADLPRGSSGPVADLDAMRGAMEQDVTARIVIGGRVVGYAGRRPGILQEALLALQRNHALLPLGGFGGAARDVAIAIGLLRAADALEHQEIGPGYDETLGELRDLAGPYREAAEASGRWADLKEAARAEDPEDASKHVLRVFSRGPATRGPALRGA